MNRLTTETSIMERKHDIKYGLAAIWKRKIKNDRYELIEEVVDKLGELEDIEDKLGCSIALYYKMCIEGTELYSLPHLDVIQWKHKYIYHKDFEGNVVFCLKLDSTLTPLYYAKDYGKTWALTREELENDINLY